MGWYITELRDSNQDLGVTIITGGSKDPESHDVIFVTQIIQDSTAKKQIPKIIYSASVNAGVAAHYWDTRAFIFNDSEVERLLRGADRNSNEENPNNLIAMTRS